MLPRDRECLGLDLDIRCCNDLDATALVPQIGVELVERARERLYPSGTCCARQRSGDLDAGPATGVLGDRAVVEQALRLLRALFVGQIGACDQ
jgi:hypothetical protein